MQVKEEPTAAGATPPPAGERPERSCVCVESGDAVVEECLLSSEVYPPLPQLKSINRRAVYLWPGAPPARSLQAQ